MAVKKVCNTTEEILNRALCGEPLQRDDSLHLLELDEPKEAAKLYAAAREARERYFGNKIFIYGFLYFSTWCRNNCAFCKYRISNRLCPRYRKTDAEVIDAAREMMESGVHLLDFTMGEDPFYYGGDGGFDSLLDLIKEIKRQIPLPIMISPGAVPDRVLEELFETGAEWYACYQETHNEKLFHQLRLNQSYHDRLRVKYKAARLGLLIEEGILSGVGESLEDVVDSMEAMKDMGAHQVRVMNFVPQEGTPMYNFPAPARTRELKIMAVLRLMFPDRLIPASLDVYGIHGLRNKLDAGANVVTSLITPSSEMVGVAESTLDVSEGYRTVSGVTPVLGELGLEKAGLEEYISWIERERKCYMDRYRVEEKALL